MVKYEIVNETNNFEIVKSGFKTRKEANEFIKDLKRFDKENNNPFNDRYIIRTYK